MVLMTVREHYPLQLVRVFPHVGEIREHEIYPRHLLIRERHTGVDQDHSALLAHGRHILADLTQPSQENDLQGLVVNQFFLPSVGRLISTPRRYGLRWSGRRLRRLLSISASALCES